MPPLPIIWSIAGLDTAGGAGLSADQRAADALGVHLCPVVAALTAQHSQGVDAVFPVPPNQLDAQLQALAADLPPRAIKTGLLGSVAAVEQVAHWVDHFRAQTPAGQDPHRQLALMVDPVLGASAGGAAFDNPAICDAYRRLLLPRATVITPNRSEARRLLGLTLEEGTKADTHLAVPGWARQLQALGSRTVIVTGGDSPLAQDGPGASSHCLDWLLSPQAQGWLCAPRLPTPHHHGTGCTFASGLAAAWVLGHLDADAAVLANMLSRHALMQAHAAGRGAGPVKAQTGFAAGPAHGGATLPWLSLGEALPWQLVHGSRLDGPSVPATPLFAPYMPPADRLYGILPEHEAVAGALQAGLRCVQLRHKSRIGLTSELPLSLGAAAEAGAQFFVNDHWREALALPLPARAATGYQLGLHLGQEDLAALTSADQAQLLAARGRIMLGLSSHSLWELARALGCGASYVACGPVQATTTKDMPWQPQGERNLRWWVAHSPVPVVAIGGLLTADDLARFAACEPAALCVVRGLGQTAREMAHRYPDLREAALGQRQVHALPCAEAPLVTLPHPVL